MNIASRIVCHNKTFHVVSLVASGTLRMRVSKHDRSRGSLARVRLNLLYRRKILLLLVGGQEIEQRNAFPNAVSFQANYSGMVKLREGVHRNKEPDRALRAPCYSVKSYCAYNLRPNSQTHLPCHSRDEPAMLPME